MLKRSHALLTLALAVPLTPAALRGQSETSPVPPRFTVGGAFGGLTGATKLDASGTADWRTGWAASLDGTYWIDRLWGVRAGGTFGQDEVRGATISPSAMFNKLTYDADVVLRYPLKSTTGMMTPYVLGGAGAISVHQIGSDTWTKFGGNVGAGFEYRFGRWGLRAEGRDYVYKFDRYGFDKTQHEVAWQGGVTVAF